MKTKDKRVLWTVALASAEFEIDRKTLAQRLQRLGFAPDTDGFYTTQQIAKAVYGDYEGERLRKTREEADALALDNETTKRILVEMAHLCKQLEPIYVKIKQEILSSDLQPEAKERILNELSSIHSILGSRPESEQQQGDPKVGRDLQTAAAA